MGSERAEAALEAAGVTYEMTRHGPVSSLAEAARAREQEPGQVIKTLVVRRGDDDFLFVLVPGDRQISWPKLRALLGVSRLSMPAADVAREVTGYERGTITPFGSLREWPVVADTRVLVADRPVSETDILSEVEPDPVQRRVSIGSGTPGVGATLDARELVRALHAVVADVTDPAAVPAP